MRRFIQCEDNGEPVLQDNETIDFKMDDVELTFEVEVPAQVGTLYITTRLILYLLFT